MGLTYPRSYLIVLNNFFFLKIFYTIYCRVYNYTALLVNPTVAIWQAELVCQRGHRMPFPFRGIVLHRFCFCCHFRRFSVDLDFVFQNDNNDNDNERAQLIYFSVGSCLRVRK